MITVVPIAIVCAYVSNLLTPTSPHPRPVTAAGYNIVETAAIKDDSTTIGIADSDIYNASEDEIKARFDEMEALGVNTVRVVIPWAAIKPAEPGSPLETLFPPDWDKMDFIVQEAQQRGFAVLGVLNATPYYGGQNGTGCLGCVGVAPDPTAFAEFAAEVAGRYNGDISAYEVWNEPNSYKSWLPAVDPVAYTKVLKAAYTAIKEADPNASVVAGVLGAVISFGNLTMDPVTFVKTMYANGAKGFFDALSYHPYNYDKTFAEQNPGFLSPLQMLLGMRQAMLDNGDDLIKIWASEYGLPTSLDPDQEQAYQDQLDFIRDFLNVWGDGLTDAQLKQLPRKYRELAATWKDWIGPAFIYTLRDRLRLEGTEQGSLGLYYFDEATGEWKMKPAAEFIKDLLGGVPPTGGATGGDLAAALAASLQNLVSQVAQSVASAVQSAVHVTQAVQKVGAQIGNALAKAIAAWAASFQKGPTTPTVAAVQAVDTAALAQSAVDESVDTSAAALSGSTTGQTRAADRPAAAEAAAAPAKAEAADPAKEAAAAPAAAAADESSAAASPETPKVTMPTDAATENSTANTATEQPAADAAKTSDQPVASTDQKTSDNPKTTAPVNRKDEDEVRGDAKKDDDKKSDGNKDADGAAATGKHTKGSVKNGTSVHDIKTKLGDHRAKKSGTPKRAAATAAG